MGLINTIKRWLNMVFSGKASVEFNVKDITSQQQRAVMNKCANIYHGQPEWLSETVKSVNFAKTICEEMAKLTTLAIGITLDDSGMGKWLQEQIDDVYYDIREWVEYAAAYGTVILKPNGESIDVVLPDKYMITEKKAKKINGCVFLNSATSNDSKTYYTRLEYHRFLENGLYCITNKCYVGATENDASKEVDIKKTPWAHLEEEVFIEKLEQPLFATLKMPGANSIDITSPLALPAFVNAVEELRDLDVAYSRNVNEIFDSQRIVLMDTDKLIPTRVIRSDKSAEGANKANIHNSTIMQKRVREQMELPKYVRNVTGNGQTDFYQEINPTLNTVVRMEGINALLSEIGFKCGFSNGYFVFNQKTGMVTATQVESDDRRTIQTIKDIRDQLESAINQLLYALSKFAELYDLAPAGEYEVTYDFGDITYNREEDRARWMLYANAGFVPKWKILEKFEGMSEEEAKAMIEEATAGAEPQLFKDEE